MIRHKYKYEMVADAIRRGIMDNSFHGETLPGEKELAERFKVGRRTLYHSLSTLAKEGTIARVQRKGSVIMARQNSMTMKDQIAVVMSRPNDANDIMYQAMIQEIVDQNYFCIATLFDQGENDESRRKRQIERIHSLLNSPIAGIIALGEGYYHYPFMTGYDHVPSVFLKCFETIHPLPGKGVFCDFESAGYMAASHLAKLGHRRISIFIHRPASVEDGTEIKVAEHPVILFEYGYRRAMKEHGLEEYLQVVHRQNDGQHNEFIMKGMLSGKSRPTGIICGEDYYAARFADLAGQMDISIPGELAVIGVYNTPWCQKSAVQLTSVSMEEEKVGREAVKLLIAKGSRRKLIKIPPKLVIRDSCGGRK